MSVFAILGVATYFTKREEYILYEKTGSDTFIHGVFSYPLYIITFTIVFSIFLLPTWRDLSKGQEYSLLSSMITIFMLAIVFAYLYNGVWKMVTFFSIQLLFLFFTIWKMNNINHIFIILSALLIVSYLFNIISKHTKIPSVILLLATGALLKLFSGRSGIQIDETHFFLNLFGVMGLILIVLEGSLDLEVTRKKLPLIGKSLLSSILILAGTSILIFLVIPVLFVIPA